MIITSSIEQVRAIAKFRKSDVVGKAANAPTWQEVLAWWLSRDSAARTPTPKQISDWHEFVSQNFTYRFNWGLGSVIALAMDEAFNGRLLEPSLESWPITELPWIVFWMKELITWGTPDPVAAYLLSRGYATTRNEAESIAKSYYVNLPQEIDANEQLNAAKIRDWAVHLEREDASSQVIKPYSVFRVSLLRNFSKSSQLSWRVVPVITDQSLYWLDPGGFPLAVCKTPDNWQLDFLERFDFTLDVTNSVVISNRYIP